MDITSLPDPTLSFSLPSIHDGTSLDCRIYLPPSILADLSSPPSPSSPLLLSPASAGLPLPWQGNAAVVAHPYAPMGGNYNDQIVRLLTKTLLAGTPTSPPYVVATFNFRGAGHSNGRTSWTAKPETADYMTVAGFVSYFAHYLEPGTPKALNPKLLCCGYSYGALVTSLLPPVVAVLAPFVRPLRSAPAAEVRRRAARWAAIQNADFAACREAAEAAAKAAAKRMEREEKEKRLGTPPSSSSPKKARLSMGIRVGTADDDLHHHNNYHNHLNSPRRSHDVAALKHMLSPSPRRSFSADHRLGEGRSSKDIARENDKTHHSVAGLLAKVRHRSQDVHSQDESKEEGEHMSVVELPVVQPAYLMVSPPVGLASNLATMTVPLPLFKRKERAVSDSDDEGAADRKLSSNPTLVVYGDADVFVSSKKIRQWTAKLAEENRALSSTTSTNPIPSKPTFESLEVATAGHFWAEGRTLYELQAAVAVYVASLGA